METHCGNWRGRDAERADMGSPGLEGRIHAVQGAAGGAHPSADALAVHAGIVVPRMLDLVGERAAGGAAEQEQQADGQRASQNPRGEPSVCHLSDSPIARPQSYSTAGASSNHSSATVICRRHDCPRPDSAPIGE